MNKQIYKICDNCIGKKLDDNNKEKVSLGERAADKVAEIIGSWKFIIIQSIFLALWVIFNTFVWIYHWDPYPFIFLNLMLSFQAAYAAPVIQMAANRQAIKDRLMAYSDWKASREAAEATVEILEQIKQGHEELLKYKKTEQAQNRLLNNIYSILDEDKDDEDES